MTRLLIKAYKSGEEVYSGWSTPSGRIIHETPDITLGKGWSLHEMIKRMVTGYREFYEYGTFLNAAHIAAVLGIEFLRKVMRPTPGLEEIGPWPFPSRFGVTLEFEFDDKPNEEEDRMDDSRWFGGKAPTIQEQREHFEKLRRREKGKKADS